LLLWEFGVDFGCCLKGELTDDCDEQQNLSELIREIGYEASRKVCFELVHSDGSTGSVCIQPQERN
jgi:hypothetical protein